MFRLYNEPGETDVPAAPQLMYHAATVSFQLSTNPLCTCWKGFAIEIDDNDTAIMKIAKKR